MLAQWTRAAADLLDPLVRNLERYVLSHLCLGWTLTIIKTRGHFPNDESAIKLLWLASRDVLNKSVRRAFDWKTAMNQFAILSRPQNYGQDLETG